VFTACLNAFGCSINIPGLIEAGTQAFSGDYLVDLDEALTMAGGKLIMMGNMNPASVIANGTPEEVYAEACERIKQADGRGLILATGCDLSATAPMENVKTVIKACKDMA